MEAKPCQHSLLHLTLFHSLSLSPLHFHVYRLGLMVCILTISVWKPADSPALWARQGRRFIREEGRGGVTHYISSHGTSLQYFSLVMWPLGADARPLGTLRASPSLIPAAHNTAAAAERGGGPVGCVDVKMSRRGREGVNISENVGQGNQVWRRQPAEN